MKLHLLLFTLFVGAIAQSRISHTLNGRIYPLFKECDPDFFKVSQSEVVEVSFLERTLQFNPLNSLLVD